MAVMWIFNTPLTVGEFRSSNFNTDKSVKTYSRKQIQTLHTIMTIMFTKYESDIFKTVGEAGHNVTLKRKNKPTLIFFQQETGNITIFWTCSVYFKRLRVYLWAKAFPVAQAQ